MKLMMIAAAAAAMLAAGPVLAQSYGPDSGTSQTPPSNDTLDPSLRAEPPGGAYQGYLDSRDIPEQTAELPDEAEQPNQPHPGTLRKFNSNSGYGPEVEFEQQRREALERQQSQQR